MGTIIQINSNNGHKAKLIADSEYKTSNYRKLLLSVPADETLVGRFMWSVSARNRRYAIDQVKNWKLKQIKDTIHDSLQELFDNVLQNALQESKNLNKGMTDQEFLNGFQAQDWNAHVKYPTIFDTLSEAIEIWHKYHLGITTTFDREKWIQLTGDKLKWPKRRYGAKDVQPYERPLAIRRHFPFATEEDFLKFLQPDGGVYKMAGKTIPEEVRRIDV